MPVPDFQAVMLPLLRIAGDGQEHTLSATIEALARHFQLSDLERHELLPSGRQARFDNRVGWAITYLKKAGLLRATGRGRFDVTDRGREVLAQPPPIIDINFLERHFPEMQDFRHTGPGDASAAVFDPTTGAWKLRPTVEAQVREGFLRLFPSETIRRDVCELLGWAIEAADAERADGWYLRSTANAITLMTGRLLSCKVTRSRMEMSVLGPVADDVRAQVGAEPEDDEEFKSLPGGVLLTFPADHAASALGLLKDAFSSFAELAMARLRRPVTLEAHVPEAVAYIGALIGRDLPQPEPPSPAEEDVGDGDLEDGDDASTNREPRVRGRAPIFEHGQRSIASLMEDIERGVIALPDLQRPFVWEDTKVRDLLDSLFLGFPVGTLVLWHTSNELEARALGTDRPDLRATTLVIDGQQRLTSLYAVLRGVDVVGREGVRRRITIAFRPRDGRFEVADAAIRNDPEFLPNVTELWTGVRPRSQIRRDLLNALRDAGRAVNDAYADAVEHNLEVAQAIANYRFPTVDIRRTATNQEASEEDVSEIFVRINNQGARLGQADFVLTLLSVFHGTLRDRIEESAGTMSKDAVLAVDTQQLLRVACAVAFGRARMSAVYRYLRGVDPTTRDHDPSTRVKRLSHLDAAADECIDMTRWRDFLLRVRHAGFVSPTLITSKNAFVNAYAFYVRGRRAHVPRAKLDEMISRWTFGTVLTARYSGASETQLEEDLARIMDVREGEADRFLEALEAALRERLTGDYWTHTLVGELETQKARAPAAITFRAAQIVLGARALFSDQLLQNLIDSGPDAGRAAREAHHLFPQAWLHARGLRDRRITNQVANLAEVGWYDNNAIGSQGPAAYVPRLREALGVNDDRWARMCSEHALPLGWESMDYVDFLRERRRRMAEIIRIAYRKLGGEADAQLLPPPWFFPGTELVWQRIAETERALRGVVREVYAGRFGAAAAGRIERAVPDPEQATLARALRARPVGAEPLSVVDYLYLSQLLHLLFVPDIWQDARLRFGGAPDARQRLQAAIGQIATVRNEIAHVREVAPERLQRTSLACGDVLELLGRRP